MVELGALYSSVCLCVCLSVCLCVCLFGRTALFKLHEMVHYTMMGMRLYTIL